MIASLSGSIMTSASRLLFLLFLPIIAFATDAGHPVTLWLAEGTNNRVYLLGSVHLLRKQDHPLPAIIDSAYDDAEVLVMELDMDDIDGFEMQSLITRLGVTNNDSTLHDLMGDTLYARAAAKAAAIDIPFAMLAKSEPWLAAITIEKLMLARLGFDPAYGVEKYLSAKAVADGKEIHGLETVAQQIGFLDDLSLRAQRSLLMQTLDETAGIEQVMDDLIRAWRVGDLRYLEDILLQDMAKDLEIYDTLLVNRNRRWVDDIDALLDENDDYLVIVGAAHLLGDDGVPMLLARRGVKITQMHQPAEK